MAMRPGTRGSLSKDDLIYSPLAVKLDYADLERAHLDRSCAVLPNPMSIAVAGTRYDHLISRRFQVRRSKIRYPKRRFESSPEARPVP